MTRPAILFAAVEAGLHAAAAHDMEFIVADMIAAVWVKTRFAGERVEVSRYGVVRYREPPRRKASFYVDLDPEYCAAGLYDDEGNRLDPDI